MNPIAIVIPTLTLERGQDCGQRAMATRGRCEARIIVSHDPNRSGFTKTCNRGIRRTSANEDICLLNDDILTFYPGWLATLQRALYKSGKFGIVGPSGGSKTAPMCNGKLGMQGLKAVRHLPFWCVLIKRRIVNEIGLLDEAFIHYASDSWYCDLVRQRGYKVVWVKDVFLRHQRHGSKLQSAWRKRDQKLYRKRRGK